MAKGDGGELKISYADLLMPEQQKALKWVLEAAGQAMGGFTLGQGYPGPGNYTPFTMPNWGRTPGNLPPSFPGPPPDGNGGGGGDKGGGIGSPVKPPGREITPALTAMEQFLSSPYSMAGGGGSNQFTQPFTNPFYSAMTGRG